METGKEYTIADDKGPKQLLICDKDGVFITEAYAEPINHGNKIFGKAVYVIQSKKKNFLIVASEKKALVYSMEEKAPIAEK
jgi:hypothetical protein